MSDEIEPFRIEVAESELRDLRERLRRTRWPEPQTVDDWSQGVPLAYLQELCGYWAHGYDWRPTEARLNALPQFRIALDGLAIHFLHVRSPHAEALPLVLTHGWPGSIIEFLAVIGPLSDPTAHGGDARDAFHVVCPSLPGYGFSDKPSEPGWGVERIAAAWAQLMARLGYERYGAAGVDWGTSITTSIGQQDPEHLAGIHLIPPLAPPDRATFADLTDAEQAALDSLEQAREWDSGYSEEQRTRPQTVGYGLVDSPVALCAWIVEKFWAWTDRDGRLENVLTRDELLDNLMLYWLPKTGASSARLYWESMRQVSEWISGHVDDTVNVPTGCSIFPKEGTALAAVGRKALHRHPPLERARQGRPFRRLRAARAVHPGAPHVLPDGPVDGRRSWNDLAPMAAEGRGERATISDMPAALTVAVAQPRCVACDAATNAREHARAVREARARVVVFPELSLTGYELDAEAVAPDDDALAAIVDACVAVEALALVGAPVADGDGREYIATLRVSRDGVDVAYRKTWLGGDERTRFCAGPGPAAIDVDGWRVGLGICKDTSVTDHIDATAALGIDLYVAGLAHLPEELREQERRALRIAARTRAHVAFASFAGSTGGGFDRTAGRSGIWSPTGAALAQAGTAPGAIAVETIDWIAAA